MFVIIRNFNTKMLRSPNFGQRNVMGSWLTMIALAVFIMLGGLYTINSLRRKRAVLSTSKNIYFHEYVEPKLNFENQNHEFFVLGKIHERCGVGLESDRDYESNNSSRSCSKLCDPVKLEYCFTSALQNKLDNSLRFVYKMLSTKRNQPDTKFLTVCFSAEM